MVPESAAVLRRSCSCGASTVSVVRRSGLARRQGPLAFGFSARLLHGEPQLSELGARADVHALLFDGELWADAHERRLPLVKGPIFPAISRMICAARSMVEAWESQRPLTLKLRAGEFGIGVRMAVGARAHDILKQFLVEAFTLSMIGGLVGILLGVGASYLIGEFAEWRTEITPQAVLLAVGFSAGVGVFFGYYPARKASRLLPIEALRYE